MVAIFWDYENCSPPSNMSGYSIANNIRHVAHTFGSVKLFKAYFDFSQSSSLKSLSLRSELQTSGVSLTDCPHNGRKDVADMMILVDMLTYAMDNAPPTTIILISGDRDFAYVASMLRLRQYRVVIVAPSVPPPHITLRSQASVLLDWNADILSKPNQDATGGSPGSVDRHSASSRSRSTSVPDSFIAYSRPTLHPPITLKIVDNPTTATGGSISGGALGQSRTLEELKTTPRKSGSMRRSPSPNREHNACIPLSPISRPQDACEDDWVKDFQDNSHHIFFNGDANLGVSGEAAPRPIGSDWIQISPVAEIQDAVWSTVLEENGHSTEKHDSSSALHVKWTDAGATPFDASTGDDFIYCPEAQRPLTAEPFVFIRPRTTSPAFPNTTLSSSVSNDVSFNAPSSLVSRPLSTTSESGISFIYRDNPSHVAGELVDTALAVGPLNADDGTKDLSVEGKEPAFTMIPGTPELNSQQPPELYSSATLPTPKNVSTMPTMDPAPVSISTPTPTTLLCIPSSSSGPVPIPADSSLSKPVTTQRQNRHPFLDSAILVNILKVAHQKGIFSVTRSSVATLLLKRDPTIYQRSGVMTFGEYAALAENAGVVQLGKGNGGESWIALHPDVLADSAPTDFATLVDILRLSHRNGISLPTRSSVAILLNKRDPTVYQRSGVTKFRQYAALAQSAGVVQLGQLQGGDAWISLHPDWRKK